MSNENRNYLLDYRESGDLGPLKIITINFAVSEDEYKTAIEWLRGKILRNDREFTLGEYGPFKMEEPPQVLVAKERVDFSGISRDDMAGVIITGMRETP